MSNANVSITESTTAATAIMEQRILLDHMSWDRFEQLSACFPDKKSLVLTYIDGRLEIMSPIGEVHERYKRTLGYFVEAYCEAKGIRYYGRGGFTLKAPGFAAGEPDESYCFEQDKEVPDLVIEVVVGNDALSKLPLYHAKRIPEVWIWRDGHLRIHVLSNEGYRDSSTSCLLPDLTAQEIESCLSIPDQYDAVRAFQASIGSNRLRPHPPA